MVGDIDQLVPEERPRIPEGEYSAYCRRAEYGPSFGGQRKLYLRFEIAESEYAGTELFLACNADATCKKPNHKLYNLWALALGRSLTKADRFNKELFTKRMFRVLVRTTERRFPRTRRLRPEYLQYSVVDTILEAETGVPADSEGREDE